MKNKIKQYLTQIYIKNQEHKKSVITKHQKRYLKNRMESKRQQKVNKQILKDMSDIFQKEASHLVLGTFVTVTQVRITPDLGQAKVYLSFILDKNKELILDQIRENTNMIRSALGSRVRHQLRVVPVLQFYLDDTAEYVEKIEKLFEGIVIPDEK